LTSKKASEGEKKKIGVFRIPQTLENSNGTAF